MIKNFLKWFQIKESLHNNFHKPPYFKVREIWWCSIGENIGFEMNGKNNYFRRPVLIIKKLDKYSFLGIPLTNTDKTGTWYVKITHNDKQSNAVISQIRNLDYRRLDKKMAMLDENDFNSVLSRIIEFLK